MVPLTEKAGSATFFDYLPSDRDLSFVLVEEDDAVAQAAKLVEQWRSSYEEARQNTPGAPEPDALFVPWEDIAARVEHATRLDQLAIGDGTQAASIHIACQPAVEFRGRIQDWIAEVKRIREHGDTVLFVAASEGRAERTVELLAEYDLRGLLIDRARRATSGSTRRFSSPSASSPEASASRRAQLQIIAEADVFDEERTKTERRGDRHRSISKTFLSDLRDLKVDDLVVHVDHGIGRFVGLKQIGVGESLQEFMELRYFGEDKLFVPGRAARSRPEVQRHGKPPTRQARRHVVGTRRRRV